MNNKEKVLGKIFEFPSRRFHVRELARECDLNPNTIINVTSKLKEDGLVLIEKKKHLVEIFGNVEDEVFVRAKKLCNLKKLFDSKIVDFLKGKFSPELISVVGSFARGEDFENSDIDIVVISKSKLKIDLKKFEKYFGKEIHLLVVDYGDLSDEFYTNLINGVVLHGFVRKI